MEGGNFQIQRLRRHARCPPGRASKNMTARDRLDAYFQDAQLDDPHEIDRPGNPATHDGGLPSAAAPEADTKAAGPEVATKEKEPEPAMVAFAHRVEADS